MEQLTLRELVKSVNQFFGLEKTVSPERLQMWAEKLKHVPDGCHRYVFERITSELDSPPRNFPKLVVQYARQWSEANCRGLSQRQEDCHECGGSGFLWCRRLAVLGGEVLRGRDGNALYEMVSYRCPKCLNWQRHVHASAKAQASRAELFQRGYDVLS